MASNHSTPSRLLQVLDICVIILCAVLMYRIRNSFWLPTGEYQLLILVIIFITTNIFSWWNIYIIQHGRWLYKSLTNLTLAWFSVALCLSFITFFTKSGEDFSRLWVLMTFISSYLLMIVSRVIIWSRLRNRNYNEDILRRVVIIGSGELGRRACDAIVEERWAGLKAVAIFDDDSSNHHTSYRGIRVEGNLQQALTYIEAQRKTGENVIKEVWIALPLSASEQIEQLQINLQNTATNVFLVPDLFGADLSRYSMVESAGLTMLNLSGTTMVGSLERLKRTEDILLSLSMGIVLSPLLLMAAIAVKMESKGPIFFKQRRYGLDGREFLVWKFRSMTVAEDGSTIKQATLGDQRVTRVGAILRKYSIDELPQLLNVLNGTMSLVGPRPHAVAHNEYYRDKVHGYMARHKIRPGITGWAQVNGCRGETEVIEKMQRRLRYDLEYIQNWSIALDIRILVKTLVTVIRDKNAY